MAKVAPGMVTLTQDQLNSLLATLGNISAGKDDNLQISVDPVTSHVNVVKNKTKSIVNNKAKQRQAVTHEKGFKHRSTDSNRNKNRPTSKKAESRKKLSKESSVEINSDGAGKENIEGSNAELRRQEDGEQVKVDADIEVVSAETEVQEPQETRDAQTTEPASTAVAPSVTVTTASVLPTPPPVVRAHLTVAERKRLQWQRERDEIQDVYDPWGRPGCGAPSKPVHTGAAVPEPGVTSANVAASAVSSLTATGAGLPAETDKRPHIAPAMKKLDASQTNAYSNPSPTTAVPSAMRSSFVVGVAAPDAEQHRRMQNEDRLNWLMELDKQRDEQRLKKAQEKAKYRTENYETWADKSSPAMPQTHVGTTPSQAVAVETAAASAVAGTDDRGGSRASSAPNTGRSQSHEIDTLTNERSTYMHGQNAYIDPVTKRELEEKRKRQLEHQAAVMAQVEQRQREKREERERKIREEMMEEAKWKGTMATQQMSSDSRQLTVKEKQEQQERQMQTMMQALEQAKLEAQRDKHLKRISHLKQGGHDVHNLQATLEAAGITPRVVKSSVSDTSPKRPSSHIPPLPDVVTHRESGRTSPLRECGTQTEAVIISSSTSKMAKSKEVSDAHIVYNADKYSDKAVDVEEVGKVEKTRPVPEKTVKRPKWGYQNTKKLTSVKQSDREIGNANKRKQSEYRRAKREQQLLNLVELNRSRIPAAKRPIGSVDSGGSGGDKIVVEKLDFGNLRETPDRLERGERGPPSKVDESAKNFHDGVGNRNLKERLVSESLASNKLGHEALKSGHITPRLGHHGAESYPRIGQSPTSLGHVISTGENACGQRDFSYSQSDQKGANAGRAGPPSPVIPAVRRQMVQKTVEMKNQPHDMRERNFPYGESEFFRGGISEFVPFLRTIERLDPAVATENMPMSRETSAAVMARKAYIEGQKPGLLGSEMEDIDDKKYVPGSHALQKDPIIHPGVVTNHPTPRQDLILQQLEQLKQIRTAVAPPPHRRLHFNHCNTGAEKSATYSERIHSNDVCF